jgi:hypothetical protein
MDPVLISAFEFVGEKPWKPPYSPNVDLEFFNLKKEHISYEGTTVWIEGSPYCWQTNEYKILNLAISLRIHKAKFFRGEIA